jgi:hypothetical protein
MAEPREDGRLYALVAEFDRPEALLHAVRLARKHGYRRMEAFSPFPVEGVAEALDFDEWRIAPIMLAGALLGGLAGFGMQAGASLDFPLNVGGRPVVAGPAFVLIAFEIMVLGAVVAGVLALLVLNRLPRLNHPLFDIPDFHFTTTDKFFLAVLADEPGFDRARVRRYLSGLHPVRIAEAAYSEPGP